MKLSTLERRILANQYRTMAMLDPKNAGVYERYQEALEHGYVSAYHDLFADLADELPADQCSLVINAMSLYEALQRSFDALDEAKRSDMGKKDVTFPGFDGNHETGHYGYAKHVVESEKRFTHVRTMHGSFNSHTPMVDTYERQLRAWASAGKRFDLSGDEIMKILAID